MNDDIPALLFALSSCAIEGSELAIELLELKDKDPDLFLQKCKEAGGFWRERNEKGNG